jgi:hypothetical protein
MYMEAQDRGFAAPAPTPVAVPVADDTSKTLLFLGVGLFLGYWFLRKEPEPEHKKNPHKYVHIESLDALLKTLGKSGEHGDKALERAIEAVRVKKKNPDDEIVEEIIEAPKLVEEVVEATVAKNPSSNSLVIIKKVARGRYYGIYKNIESLIKKNGVKVIKNYSVELLDSRENPIEDGSNQYNFKSLPKAKAYIKELKGV